MILYLASCGENYAPGWSLILYVVCPKLLFQFSILNTNSLVQVVNLSGMRRTLNCTVVLLTVSFKQLV